MSRLRGAAAAAARESESEGAAAAVGKAGGGGGGRDDVECLRPSLWPLWLRVSFEGEEGLTAGAGGEGAEGAFFAVAVGAAEAGRRFLAPPPERALAAAAAVGGAGVALGCLPFPEEEEGC